MADTGTPTVDEGYSTAWGTQPAPGSPDYLRANSIDLSDTDSAALLTAAEQAVIDAQIAGERKEEPPPQEGEPTPLALPHGMADDPAVRDFAVFAQNAGVDQTTFDNVLGWYGQRELAIAEQFREQDDRDQFHAKEELRALFGNRVNSNLSRMVTTLTTALPPGVFETIFNARLSSGKALGNDVPTIQWLMAAADAVGRRHTAPAASAPASAALSLDREIANIERQMGTRAYLRDTAMQERLRELYELKHGR